MNTITLLSSIGSTEPSTFNEMCHGLEGDCPEKGDSAAWGELFETIRGAETLGLIKVDRVGGRIDSLILTPTGVERLRESY